MDNTPAIKNSIPRANTASSSISLNRAFHPAEKIVYLAKQEIYQILEDCRQNEKRDYLLMATLWKTGLRISEVIALKKKDINFFDKTAKVVWLKKRRKAERSIPLNNDLAYELSVYCGNLNRDDLIFPINRKRAFDIIKEHAIRAGIEKKVSPHTFRHSFAVHFLKETKDLPSLQKLLGHNQITTTMVYLRLAHSDLRRSLDSANF